MHGAIDPQANPFSCNRSRTKTGTMWLKSSIESSTVSNPHFLNFEKNCVDAFVKGHANKKVLIPNRMRSRCWIRKKSFGQLEINSLRPANTINKDPQVSRFFDPLQAACSLRRVQKSNQS